MDEVGQIAARLSGLDDPVGLLQLFFTSAPVAFALYRADGLCLFTNEAFRTRFGERPPGYNVFLQQGAAERRFSEQLQRTLCGETQRLPAAWYSRESAAVTTPRLALELTLFPVPDRDGVVQHAGVWAKDVTAEQLLLAERDQVHALREHSVEVTSVSRADRSYAYLSPSITRILGYPADRLPASIVELLHPDEDAAHRELIAQVLANPGRPYQSVHRIRRFDGSFHWFSVTRVNLLDHPTIQGIVSYSHDITELKLANEALRHSEEEITATLISIGDAVIATDADGRVVRMNPVAEHLTGFPLADARGLPLDEVFRIINHDSRQTVESPVTHVLREGVIVGLANHTVLVARDGTERSIADSAAPIRIAGGPVQGVVLVFRDVSAEERAEQEKRKQQAALERTGAMLRLALEASRAFAWTIDFATDETTIFGDMREVAGADPSMSREERIALVHPDDRAGVRAAIAVGYQRLAPPHHVYRNVLPGGEIRWIDASSVFVRDAAGTITGASGLSIDITAARRAEEARLRTAELERENLRITEASRLKSDFLANMSHELRTPLNAIIGFAALLHDGEVDPASPEHKEFLGDIVRSGQHLLELINDILDLAKIEAGKLDFRPERVELGAIVGEVCSILRQSASSKGIALEAETDPAIGAVTIDPARLKQVLYNYLSNAIKFTAAGGRVAVRTRCECADTFRLEVEDNGIGIAESEIGQLFVVFHQLEGGAGKRHGGTGLGLALTRRLVTAQGGEVGVRSVLGEGSVFHAVLPRRPLAGVGHGPEVP